MHACVISILVCTGYVASDFAKYGYGVYIFNLI